MINGTVEQMLEKAKTMPKDNDRAYEECKRMIENAGLKPRDYDQAIRKLTKILEF